MSNVCKFRIGDRVRVTDPSDPYHDRAGLVTARDHESHYCYDIHFDNGDTGFYAANHLVLALGATE